VATAQQIDKLDASSPTAALESVLLTAVIDAHEGRDVAALTSQCLCADRLEDDADKAIMHVCGKLAELMVKVAPEIYKYVIVNSR
jgi:hypothetical protein